MNFFREKNSLLYTQGYLQNHSDNHAPIILLSAAYPQLNQLLKEKFMADILKTLQQVGHTAKENLVDGVTIDLSKLDNPLELYLERY